MTKTKKKFYAVAAGHKPGIYTEWFGPKGAQVQVKGFAGARYKGFATQNEAKEWISEQGSRTASRDLSGGKTAEEHDDTVRSVLIYTDGGAINNPGPGGYGVVIINGGMKKEFSGGFRSTTNNRMELMGAIVGLSQSDKDCRITLRTDSRYVVNGIMKGWAKRWRKNKWMRTKTDPAENYDLWERLLVLTEMYDVVFEWVKGHAGHKENERCDELAKAQSRGKDLPADTNYENGCTTIVMKMF